MDTSSLPHWAQALFYIIVAIGTASTGIYSYFKKNSKNQEVPATAAETSSVISASFLDSRLMKEFIEAIRELQDELGRDHKKAHRLMQDLREAVNELNESIIVQTDTTMNLVRFVNRGPAKAKVVEE